MADLNLQAIITAKDEASKVIKGFAGSMKSAEAGSKALLGGLTAMGAGVVAFGVKSVKAYNQSVEAGTKLATNLLAVKGNTMENVDSLSKLASQLQNVGVIEDDVIKAGMSQLATFGLQGKTIETLTPKITDMVAQLKGHNATAEDMVAINNLVGKVMTGNIGALSRYGVTLSETQKKQMENANETERASLMVEILSQNYGKVNESLRNTPEGQITALKNNIGDLMEIIGSGISEVITPLIGKMNEFIGSILGTDDPMKTLQSKFQWIIDNKEILIGAIIVGLVPAFWALGSSIWAALTPLLPFIAIGSALGYIVKLLVDHFGGWNNIMVIIRPILETIRDWIVNIWSSASELYNHIAMFLKPIFEILGKVIQNTIIPVFTWLWNVIANQLYPALKEFWEVNRDKIIPILKILGGILLGTVVVAFLIAIGVITTIIAVIGGIILVISKVIKAFVDFSNNIKENINKAWDAVRGFGNGIYDAISGGLSRAISTAKNYINTLIGYINKGIEGMNKIPGASIPKIPQLAEGGSVITGQPYIVGERGPELFIPSASGRIVPNNQMTQNVTFNIGTINANNQSQVDNLLNEISRRLETVRLGV